MEIKGYLVQNQEGSYLSQSYFWFAHERFKDAWVHPENNLEVILRQSENWEIKPAKLTKATYDTERKNSTTLVSNAIDIQGLDIEQVRNVLKRTS